MCTKGLHGLIRSEANNGDIRGVLLCRNGPKLMHLLFVYDSLVFCGAKIEECQSLLNILAKYERATGQQINRAKTTIFFSKSTSEETQLAIKEMLRVPMVQ